MASPISGGAQPAVSLRGIGKRFGSVAALRGATFEAYGGEIHVLLGENGAGKTSLMSVLAGLYRPDQGEISIHGQPVTIRNPKEALALGIAMVPQHVELVETLSVWENVALGDRGGGWLARRRARAAVAAAAADVDLDIDVDARVATLAAGQQQKVEILKTLYRKVRILILDEPTTFLTPQECDALFAVTARLAQRGLCVLLVTHKLRDALRIGHRLTVLRSGEVVAALPAGEADEAQLVRWLMRQDVAGAAAIAELPTLPALAPQAPVLLQVQALHAGGGKQWVALRDLRLSLRQGEIRGIAGVAGSGQRELAAALLGFLPLSSGSIRLGERELAGLSVSRRLRAGLALIPEDRIHEGILPGLPLYETLVLGQQRELFGGISYRAAEARRLAAAAIAEYEIKAPGPEAGVAGLSGGNLQKVIVARAVAQAGRHSPAVLVAVNPTRGLDLRTVAQVHARLRAVAAGGGAVLLMSEDLDELLEACHAISVIHQGSLVADFDRAGFDRYRIGAAMLGRREEAGA